jgi:thiamine biosynthesis lipoprotein
MARGEQIERFACFGSRCTVLVSGADATRSASAAVREARHSLELWHEQFSRFLPDSELSRLNADPRREVPVSPLLARLVAAIGAAGRLSDGLVDATLIEPLQAAGYEHDLGESLELTRALALAPPRKPASASAASGWRELDVDLRNGIVTRPRGLQIDSGGLAKGLFADVLAARLARHRSFAVDCAGDIAIGGRAGAARRIEVESPLDDSVLHTFEVAVGGIATSGIARRSWRDEQGRPAHHLLDPASGRPAFTGIVQATALAPSALEAEIRAKCALLAGPRAARAQLPHGGVIVLDSGAHRVFEPQPSVALAELSGFVAGRSGTRDAKSWRAA